MSGDLKKKDWAAITDDEEESEDMEEVSPREEQGKPEENLEGLSVEARGSDKATLGATQGVSQPENHKANMISVIQNSTLPKFHINIYNLHPDTTADELREFYQPINIDDVLPIYKKNMYDLEFSNKEDALKVIEKGAGTIRNTQFQMRISIKTSKPNDYNKKFEKRDKTGRGYGNRDQTRNYNERRGGNYSEYVSYEQRDQRGYGQSKGNYTDKRTEGRYWEKKSDQGGGFKKNKETYRSEYVKKEEESGKVEVESPGIKELPKEWEAAWKQRASQSEIPDEPTEKTEKEEKKEGRSPRKGDNYYHRRDNYQGEYSRGDDRYGKREEYKDNEIVKKGRGQTKYGKEHVLEQDKILQVNERQDSNKSHGSGKGTYNTKGNYYKEDYSYIKKSNYDEKWGYDKDQNYNKGEYHKRGPKGGSKYEEGGSRNEKGGSRIIYTEKKVSNEDTEGKKPGSQSYVEKKNVNNQEANKQKDIPSSPETKKRPSQTGSKNTANPFSVLMGQK